MVKDLRQVVDYLAVELDHAMAKQTALPARGTRPQPVAQVWDDDDPATGAAEQPIPLDTRAAEAGWILHNTLASWATLILRVRGRNKAATATADTSWAVTSHAHGPAILGTNVTVLAAFLIGYAEHLRHHPEGSAAVEEIGAAVAEVRRCVDLPTHRTVVDVGPCPETNCAGQVRAYVPATDGHTAHMACTACHVKWQPWQWNRAGARIRRAIARAL